MPPEEGDSIAPATAQEEKTTGTPTNELESAHPTYEIDPVVEARVVRKLDYRVPTLLAALCTT